MATPEKFFAVVAQHPVQSRMSGFTIIPEKRDPPLVVKVKISEKYVTGNNGEDGFLEEKVALSAPSAPIDEFNSKNSEKYHLLSNRIICLASLVAENSSDLDCLFRNPENPNQASFITELLSGNSCITGVVLDDLEDGGKELYFPFTELAIRVEGSFRFKIHMLDMTNNKSIHTILESEILTVYTAKKYPGNLPSTKLTRHLGWYGVEYRLNPKTIPLPSSTAEI